MTTNSMIQPAAPSIAEHPARVSLHPYTLLAALLIVFVGLVTFLAPTDPDVWWHLRDGRLVLEQGIARQDPYSYTALGRPWYMQEWLTEVTMHTVKSTLGYGALTLLFGLAQAAGGGLVYLMLRERGARRVVALVLLMCYLVFAAPHWGVRPQVLTPIFLGVFYLLLTRYKYGNLPARALWALPVLTVIWTNMHASYFMGIALLGAFVVGEAANRYLYRPQEQVPLRPLILALAGCLVATGINPYFIELWLYPLTYAFHGTSSPLLQYLQEWQSPDFHQPTSLVFGASLVLLGLVGIARAAGSGRSAPAEGGERARTRIDVTDAILVIAFTMLALQAVRLVPLYGLIVLPILGGAIARAWPAMSRESEEQAAGSGARGGMAWVNLAALATGTAAISWFVLTSPAAQTGPEPRTRTGFVYPVGAADYLSGLSEPVRMMNDFGWGSYLLYRLYPQHLVFIDGRADMYREGIFEDFMTVQDTNPGWREVLDKYDVNFVVFPPGTPLDYAVAHEDEWEVAYKDDVSVIYRRVR
jgi:hypothetical protein